MFDYNNNNLIINTNKLKQTIYNDIYFQNLRKDKSDNNKLIENFNKTIKEIVNKEGIEYIRLVNLNKIEYPYLFSSFFGLTNYPFLTYGTGLQFKYNLSGLGLNQLKFDFQPTKQIDFYLFNKGYNLTFIQYFKSKILPKIYTVLREFISKSHSISLYKKDLLELKNQLDKIVDVSKILKDINYLNNDFLNYKISTNLILDIRNYIFNNLIIKNFPIQLYTNSIIKQISTKGKYIIHIKTNENIYWIQDDEIKTFKLKKIYKNILMIKYLKNAINNILSNEYLYNNIKGSSLKFNMIIKDKMFYNNYSSILPKLNTLISFLNKMYSYNLSLNYIIAYIKPNLFLPYHNNIKNFLIKSFNETQNILKQEGINQYYIQTDIFLIHFINSYLLTI